MMPQLLAHLFGDYILQSDWMAQNKVKYMSVASIHALVYSLCFLPLALGNTRWCLPVIFLTHMLIDRYRLARYVVWAKNWMGPRRWTVPMDDPSYLSRGLTFPGNLPWKACNQKTGMLKRVPPHMADWLLIIADNTLHLTINYLALRFL